MKLPGSMGLSPTLADEVCARGTAEDRLPRAWPKAGVFDRRKERRAETELLSRIRNGIRLRRRGIHGAGSEIVVTREMLPDRSRRLHRLSG